MALHAGGSAETIWAGTGSTWHAVDLTGDRGSWSWEEVDALVGQVELHDHPQGNRDSDVWVDAFRLTVDYTVDEEVEDDDPTGEDTAVEDAVEDTEADAPPEDEPSSYTREADDEEPATGCGCAAGGAGPGPLVGLVALLGLARVRRQPPPTRSGRRARERNTAGLQIG